MNLLELTKFLVNNIVLDPEKVSFQQYDDEDMLTIEILASDDVIGKIIGKNGSMANAIRTIVQASSYANNGKKVSVNINSL